MILTKGAGGSTSTRFGGTHATRSRPRVAPARIAPAAFLLLAAGCGTGGLGQPCKTTDEPPLGGLACDPGLVCNTHVRGTVCEEPNSHGVGEACTGDDSCRMGLMCKFLTCRPLPGLDEPCSDACASGLACVKVTGSATCQPVDGGALETGAPDVGALDAGALDAGLLDAPGE
jgi:hypothetical protein